MADPVRWGMGAAAVGRGSPSGKAGRGTMSPAARAGDALRSQARATAKILTPTRGKKFMSGV